MTIEQALLDGIEENIKAYVKLHTGAEPQTPIRAVQLLQEFDARGWPVDADDDFYVSHTYLVDERTGGYVTGCRVSWDWVEMVLTPARAERLAVALLTVLHRHSERPDEPA